MDVLLPSYTPFHEAPYDSERRRRIERVDNIDQTHRRDMNTTPSDKRTQAGLLLHSKKCFASTSIGAGLHEESFGPTVSDTPLLPLITLLCVLPEPAEHLIVPLQAVGRRQYKAGAESTRNHGPVLMIQDPVVLVREDHQTARNTSPATSVQSGRKIFRERLESLTAGGRGRRRCRRFRASGSPCCRG